MIVRVTKSFRFEMAHALGKHDGPCRNIHGHSYQLYVTLKGVPVDVPDHPKTGMVLDFSDLKKIVNESIISRFDHALVLAKENYNGIQNVLTHHKLILTDFQPTCENLTLHFVKLLQSELALEGLLHHVLLKETSTSFAEWYAEDNTIK